MTTIARWTAALACGLALLATVGAGAASARSRPHSDGPVVTSATTAPWAVQITATDADGDGETCTGSIIDSTHVLTAGHCAYDEDDDNAAYPVSSFTVTAGTVNVNSTASTQQTSGVSAVRVGPGYVPGVSATTPNDVAVLTLSTALKTTPEVAPVAVAPSGTAVAAGTAANAYSWGTIDPSGQYDGYEHSLPSTVAQPWTCGSGRPNTLCTVSAQGDNCPGDSGSGIIVDTPTPTLVGVLDYGPTTDEGGCTTGHETGSTLASAPEIAQWLAGSATPAAAPTTSSGAVLYPATSQVGATMSCAAPTFADASSVSDLFIDGAQQVVQSGPTTFAVPASLLGQTVGCVAVATGAGGTTYSVSGFSGTIQPQSDPGLQLTITRGGRVQALTASSGIVTTVTVTRSGASQPLLVRHIRAGRTTGPDLHHLLPGIYKVCLSSASQGVYAAAQTCRTWRHGGSVLRFVAHRTLRHARVRLTVTAPLRGARAQLTWSDGHTVRHARVRLRARTTLRAPRGHWTRLKLTIAGRRADGVRLSAGTLRIRLRH